MSGSTPLPWRGKTPPQRSGAPALRRPSVPPAGNIETVGTRSPRYAMFNQRANRPFALSGQCAGLPRRLRAAIALRRHAKVSCAGELTLGRLRIRPATRGADWPMPRVFAQRRAALHHGRSATSPVLVATCPPRLPEHDLSAAVVDHPALDGADATLRARPRPMGHHGGGGGHLWWRSSTRTQPFICGRRRYRSSRAPARVAWAGRTPSSRQLLGVLARFPRFHQEICPWRDRTHPRAIAKVRRRLRARQPGSKTIRDRPVEFL